MPCVRMACLGLLAGVLAGMPAGGAEGLQAGFAEADITPTVGDDRPVWLAGYSPGRRATGVHDPLLARCVVLREGKQKVAVVSVDLVGLQFPTVQRVRQVLRDFRYVVVSSTHNHEGPDVIGIWGPSFLQRGVDDQYLTTVVDGIVRGVRRAERALEEVEVGYGSAEDPTLLRDSRLPEVKDAVLRVVRFNRPGTGKLVGLLVQWSCHPETLGSRNTLVSADFPAATVAALKRRHGCQVVYLSGAVGGLMAPPHQRIRDPQGNELQEGDFAYAKAYGEAVAELASRAVDKSAAVRATPLAASAQSIAVPVENTWYRAARVLGVVNRDGHVWTGDYRHRGEPLNEDNADQPTAIETEVGCLRLGELRLVCVPGEIYPELVYGQVADPPEAGADFPQAAIEPCVADLLRGSKWLLLGLANDEIGYIIPKRQWDSRPPFAYGRSASQYGEINSCGPDIAPIVIDALAANVQALAEE